MKKSLYFLFILALFCLTGCKDALVPKPIKLTCNINTFDALYHVSAVRQQMRINFILVRKTVVS